MQKGILFFLIIFFSFSESFANSARIDTTPTSIITWDSPEGLERIQRSIAKENLWKLLRFYETQNHYAYCGIASVVMAFNSLSIEAPPSQLLKGKPFFLQQEFFTENVKAVLNKEEVEKYGMSLNDMAGVLPVFPVIFSKYEAVNLTHEDMKKTIIEALKNPKQRVLSLYLREILGLGSGGHWSPIAAYDEASDTFLVLDVARFKYPPMWIPTTDFFKSMQTTNKSGKSRGFIILEPNVH